MALLLSACAAPAGPTPAAAAEHPAGSAEPVAESWQAPLPHGGGMIELAQWWQQFGDPTLLALLDAAQAASPTIAQAGSRIEQASAARTAAGAALLPSLDLGAGAGRGRPELATPLATSAAIRGQAAWEIDLFGARRAGLAAADARLGATQAGWHAARVAVAAETATLYTSLRACEAQWLQSRADAESRAETARLTALTAKAGLQAPADAALAAAGAAQAQAQARAQGARCERDIKALVALTGVAEPTLRERLSRSIDAAATGSLPAPAETTVASVPADLLGQRPDVRRAALDVVAASAESTQVDAARYPRIGLSGQLGIGRISTSKLDVDGTLWSIGPVSISLPVFDAGSRRANSRAARARYDEATQLYAATLRQAVREVEEALVGLDSTAARGRDAQTAVEGFEVSLRATAARFNGGLGTLFELEDARRSALQARIALIDLQRERTTSWIALYRALGGGWRADASGGLR